MTTIISISVKPKRNRGLILKVPPDSRLAHGDGPGNLWSRLALGSDIRLEATDRCLRMHVLDQNLSTFDVQDVHQVGWKRCECLILRNLSLPISSDAAGRHQHDDQNQHRPEPAEADLREDQTARQF